jgi:VCBS repeat-containing protein
VIGGVSTGAVAEDGTLTAGGTLTIADVDSGQNHFQAVAPASLIGTYGVFKFDSNTGVWGYTLNNGAAESLPTGQVAHDKLTVTSVDGTASQLIDVSITSTNDAPVIQDGVHSRVSNISANGGQPVFDGQFFLGDSDFTVSDPDGPHFGIAITFVDNAHGTWQYQLAGTTTWTAITVSSGHALLLSATDKIRFNGDASAPVETMMFKAWDGSDGSTHGTVITLPSDVGGSSAFSAGTYFAATKNDGPAGVYISRWLHGHGDDQGYSV